MSQAHLEDAKKMREAIAAYGRKEKTSLELMWKFLDITGGPDSLDFPKKETKLTTEDAVKRMLVIVEAYEKDNHQVVDELDCLPKLLTALFGSPKKLPPKSEKLEAASPWDKTEAGIKLRCRNRYGSVAFFRTGKDVILIAHGDEDGYEPDKDGMLIDKKDIPQIIEYLQGVK